MKFLLGKKIGMSQMFDRSGSVIPVTILEAGPCVVTQIRSKEHDGYHAVQLGFGKKRALSKALQGHFKNSGSFRWVREFRFEDRKSNIEDQPSGDNMENKDVQVGDTIDAGMFKEGDVVRLSAVSKGKGFQGVVKRHGFHGAPASHGTKHTLRAPGSIGSSFPEHVFKGMRMGGRMGGERVSVKNLRVASVDQEHNVIAVTGAIPGARGTLVEIRGEER